MRIIIDIANNLSIEEMNKKLAEAQNSLTEENPHGSYLLIGNLKIPICCIWFPEK